MNKKHSDYINNEDKAVIDELADNMFKDFCNCIQQGIYVANLSYRLALSLGLSKDEAYNLKIAGLVHDLGKLKISPYLYGRNTYGLLIEETKYKRMHPTISYELLKENHFPIQIAEAVHRHHECYDGSGYPDNLSGDNIPLESRILRITDEFVDLITDRPYRKAFDIDAAVDIMIEEIKNMDLRVFIAFQRLIHEEDTLLMLKNSKICLDDLSIRDILDN